MKTAATILVGAAITLLAGCIVSDQVTTVTVQPDGSADWVRFQSNIHSTLKGAKADEELNQYVEEFDSHRDGDYVHLMESGGQVLERRWVRHEVPLANIFAARFPDWSSFQKYYTIRDENGEVIATPQFTQCGDRRKLSIVIPLPKDEQQESGANPTVEDLRQEQANSISETRVVVAGGQIIASHGFTVAVDKRSALLDPAKIRAAVEAKPKDLEIFLEWEITSN